MTRVPRAGAVSSAAGSTVKLPWPSDCQRQASSLPARRETTSTVVATMKAEIETDAELADQRRSLRSAREAFEEGLGAGARDRAEIVDHLRLAHADAVVGDRELARPAGKADLELRVGGKQVGGLQGDHAQPFAGVGGVGDQLAEKDVAVRIDRMHHEVQEFRDLGLEAPGFLGLTVAHANFAVK